MHGETVKFIRLYGCLVFNVFPAGTLEMVHAPLPSRRTGALLRHRSG